MIDTTERQSETLLLAELKAAGAVVRGRNSIRCPFHDDRHPSGGLYLGDDGAWRFKCQAQCCGFNGDVFDVRARSQNRPLGEVLPKSQANGMTERTFSSVDELKAGSGNVEAAYAYTHPDTGSVDLLVLRVIRNGRKAFVQAHRRSDGLYVMRAPEKPWPIYNRKRVIDAHEVIVVEGEKCVHALHHAGWVATTSPGGAGKAQHADWSLLAGKRVYLWPDNDPADEKTGQRTGISHMREVARILDSLDPRPTVYWIDPDSLDLPPKGDVVDLLGAIRDREQAHALIASVLDDAKAIGAASEVRALLTDTISGKRRAVDWPWPALSKLTKALLPGALTVLCGDPGCSKSFLMLQCAMVWHENGEPVAILELEETKVYHLYRALAIRSGVGALFDDDWVRRNGDTSLELHEQHARFINDFAGCVHEPKREDRTLGCIADWIGGMAASGKRIIIVDPVTMADTGREPWIEDRQFITRTKDTAEQYGCSVVLVTHPRIGSKGAPSLEHMAGGAAYARFPQSVLWLRRHEPPVDRLVTALTIGGWTPKQVVTANREVVVMKSRNATGAGHKIAYEFDSNLTFSELGVVVEEKPNAHE